ncbi:MAG: ASKHA domain-containing protein [Syntrophomonas sp.]
MSEQVRFTAIGPEQKEKDIWAIPGQNLREALVLAGLDPGGTCGGRGTCGKCKVRIEGNIKPISAPERNKLLPDEIKAGERLSCLCTVENSLTVTVDYSEILPGLKAHPRSAYLPIAEKQLEIKHIFLPGFDRQNPLPLFERLKAALPGLQMRIPPENFNELAALDRQGRPTMELYALIFGGREVRGLSREKQSAYGAALDLGTTSLQGVLVDLSRGEAVAMASHTNLQRVYGQDIISRISYCLENRDGLDNLHRILINGIDSMVEELCEKAGISPDKMASFTVVGNPVMLHFLLRFQVGGFGAAPYCGLFTSDYLSSAATLGIKANPEAAVWLLPQIGGFVGSDLLAGLMTITNRMELRFLYIDIGTNGEILVGNKGDFWTASAAAGPAFEGGAISSGMRADAGAIDRVRLQDGLLDCHVLGQTLARGICGSGIIDLLGCLLEANYLDANGIFTEAASEKLTMRSGTRGAELLLYTQGQADVIFNQDDVRQVQLAKSAVRTAIEILLNKAGLKSRDLDVVILAGAFGSYIDPEQAIRIGLLPEVEPGLIKNVGNAAAQGAVMALFSPSYQEAARTLSNRVQYVELATQADFQQLFIKNLNFY